MKPIKTSNTRALRKRLSVDESWQQERAEGANALFEKLYLPCEPFRAEVTGRCTDGALPPVSWQEGRGLCLRVEQIRGLVEQ